MSYRLLLLLIFGLAACRGETINTPQADTGNQTDAATITADVYVPTAACGDGQTGADEGCDDGNNSEGDGCSADCVIESGQIELAQAEAASDVGQDIAISGRGFRFSVELRACVVSEGACRFQLQTLNSDEAGRVTARLRSDQSLSAEIGICDSVLNSCSNALLLSWNDNRPECQENSDCGVGMLCEEGQCTQPLSECDDQGLCPAGQRCVDNRCIDANRDCVEHADCPMYEFCSPDVRRCALLRDGACRNDEPCEIRCEIALEQSLGRCINCEDDSLCPPQAICDQGECVQAPECTETSCPPPGRCENQRCIGGAGCSSESCPLPGRCVGNQCVHDEQPQACRSHVDCAAHEQCISPGGQSVCVSRCNHEDMGAACAGEGGANCVCTMLLMACDQQTGLCVGR
ncbi:MAG: hypothetical protein OSB21_02020 [Myxococcota bacterium]|nr:hypothetical protein [Myxococcota bacterium]